MRKPSHPLLDSLKKDIEFYREAIKEVAEDIINNEFSKFPVFVAHQHEVAIGELILNKDELQTSWSINATVLEELIEKGVIQKSKVEAFKQVYKDPAKFICIFLVTERGGNFIFLPYEKGFNPENN